MAIVFNAPEDRFGIRSAGSALAQALMQNAADRSQQTNTLQRDLYLDQLQTQRDLRQEQSLIGKEQRQLELRQKFGPLLGQALEVAYDVNASPQEKSQALNSYISAGGSLSDVSQAYKALSQENQSLGLLNQLGIRPTGINSPAVSMNQNSQLQAQQKMGGDVVDVNRQETVSNGNFYDSIDENTAIALSGSGNPALSNIGKSVLEAKKINQSKFEADRKYNTQRALPYLKGIDDQRAAVENKLRASQQLDAALAEGKTGGFSIDNIARIFGRPELLSQSAAQQLGAVKELLVSNIGRVGARPNQWIEQQISLALPDLGKSSNANKTLAAAVKGEIQLADQRIKLTDELSAQDEANLGYVKGDIAARVDKALKPYADQINTRTAYTMRDYYEQEAGATELRKNLIKKVPEGTPLTKNMYLLFKEKYGNSAQAIDNAKKLGYTVISTETAGGIR
jgi:hypothetical protein